MAAQVSLREHTIEEAAERPSLLSQSRTLMETPASILAISRAFIWAAGFLVPRETRSGWRAQHQRVIALLLTFFVQRGEPRRVVWTRALQYLSHLGPEALWLRVERQKFLRSVKDLVLGPWFVLAILLLALSAIAARSEWFAATRAALSPLPYRMPGQLAAASVRGHVMGFRSAIALDKYHLIEQQAKLFEASAAYTWQRTTVQSGSGRSKTVSLARVSPSFFNTLGVGAAAGRLLSLQDRSSPIPKVVVSARLRRELFGQEAGLGRRVVVDGKLAEIVGVLPPHFWFLSRNTSVWTLLDGSPASGTLAGVLVRLRSGVTLQQVEKTLLPLTRKIKPRHRGLWIEVSPLETTAARPLRTFALGLILGLSLALAASAGREGGLTVLLAHSGLAPRRWPAVGFLLAKSTLLVAIVFLTILEFAGAGASTLTGGTDFGTEPRSTWLFLLGCGGFLYWSFEDQRKRCRACLQRLTLPVRVGSPGRLLFDKAGMELVCEHGHGTLYLSESSAESPQWVELDASWSELFKVK